MATGIKIASLYAEIGGDTSKLEASLKGTKRELAEAEGRIKQFSSHLAGEFSAGLGKSTVGVNDFRSQLLNAARAADLNANQISAMTASTGMWTDAENKAAGATHNLALKSAQLAEKVKAGEISAQEAGRQFAAYAKTQEVTAASTSRLAKAWAGLKTSIPALGGALSLLTNPIALGAAGMGLFVKNAKEWVKLASDMNETTTKTGVIFGNNARAIEQFASTAATSLGQTKKQAMDAASTFAVFGKGAGLAGKDLVGFSTQLTMLTADLASFYNTSPEDAITAIGAALRGEMEPIRRYGVLLDDASLRQQALKMGIVDTVKNALSPQARALAAQALIMEQTKDAQGDFARTSDGLANQQRILTAQVADLKTELGQGLIPVAISATRVLNNWLSTMNLAGTATELLGEANRKGLLTDKELVRITNQLRSGKGDLTKITEDLTAKLDEYDKINQGIVHTEELRRNAAKGVTEAIKANITATRDMIPAAEAGYRAYTDQAQAARDYQFELDQNAKKLGELEGYMSGQFGPTMRDHQQTQRDINQQLRDEQANLDKLISQGYKPLSEKVQESKDKINDLNTKLAENEEQYKKTMGSMVVSLLTAKAQADGIIEDSELELITGVAKSYGLIDKATKDATDKIGRMWDDLVNAPSAQAAQAMIDNMFALDGRTIRTAWDIFVATNYHGNIPGMGGGQTNATAQSTGSGRYYNRDTGEVEYRGQHGLDMVVPPGYPNDSATIRASSGERVIVVPQGQPGNTISIGNISMTAAPGMNSDQLYKDFIARLQREMRNSQSSGRHYAGA